MPRFVQCADVPTAPVAPAQVGSSTGSVSLSYGSPGNDGGSPVIEYVPTYCNPSRDVLPPECQRTLYACVGAEQQINH